MNIKQTITVMRDNVVDWYDRVSGQADARRKRVIHYGLMGILAVLVVVGLWLLRSSVVSYRERNAQKALSASLAESFNAQYRGDHVDWNLIARNDMQAAEDNSSSSLKPYFLALQADALSKAGDAAKALEVMDTMLNSMSSRDPLMPLYALKRALMQLDAQEQTTQERGLAVLEQLARDTSNEYQDAAQFYLGHYYWTHDKTDKAQQVWQALVAERRVETGMRSPWADLASSKLSQS